MLEDEKNIIEEISSLYGTKLGIVKKVRPTALDREENKLITKYRTNLWGLNRIVVAR